MVFFLVGSQDKFGEPVPFRFQVGDPSVISGLSLTVQRMTTGSASRVVIPGRLGYQTRDQLPIPREVTPLSVLVAAISRAALAS